MSIMYYIRDISDLVVLIVIHLHCANVFLLKTFVLIYMEASVIKLHLCVVCCEKFDYEPCNLTFHFWPNTSYLPHLLFLSFNPEMQHSLTVSHRALSPSVASSPYKD